MHDLHAIRDFEALGAESLGLIAAEEDDGIGDVFHTRKTVRRTGFGCGPRQRHRRDEIIGGRPIGALRKWSIALNTVRMR